MAIFRSFGAKKKLLLKYALVSNTCFGVLLRGVGDLVQQTIEIKSNGSTPKTPQSKYDWTRTSKWIENLDPDLMKNLIDFLFEH